METDFKIRFLEEESQFTENQMDIMVDDCIEIYLQAGLRKSLSVFERILNKTFDYNGSLSYIINTASAPEEQIEGSTSTVSY